jgi:hypothetical protein
MNRGVKGDGFEDDVKEEESIRGGDKKREVKCERKKMAKRVIN